MLSPRHTEGRLPRKWQLWDLVGRLAGSTACPTQHTKHPFFHIQILVEIVVKRKWVWKFKVQFVKLDQVPLNKTTVYLFIYIYMITWLRKHNVQFNKTSRIVYFIYLFIYHCTRSHEFFFSDIAWNLHLVWQRSCRSWRSLSDNLCVAIIKLDFL